MVAAVAAVGAEMPLQVTALDIAGFGVTIRPALIAEPSPPGFHP